MNSYAQNQESSVDVDPSRSSGSDHQAEPDAVLTRVAATQQGWPSPIATGRDVIVPFNLLSIGASNVRKKQTVLSILDLAALIKAQGLLQRLSVIDAGGGRFDVIAGGRRLRALALLVEQGDLAEDAGIECKLYQSKRAVELSLTENTGRENLHPADEFVAFARLIDDGLSIDQVAGRFGVSRLTVERRMALAKLAPRFIDLYRDDEITMAQMQALTLTSDPEKQWAVWDSLPPYSRSAYLITQHLTDEDLPIDHRFVRFVGLDAYSAAGGAIRRDLFSDEGQGWVEDAALLHRLKAEKLEAALQPFRDAGWSWVEGHADLNLSPYYQCDTVLPVSTITAEQAASIEEAERLLEQAEEAVAVIEQRCELDQTEEEAARAAQLMEEAQTQVDTLEEMVGALHDASAQWSAEQLQSCGVIVFIASTGVLDVRDGLRRPQDKKAMAAELKKAGKSIPAALQGGGKDRPAFSERLMLDMTAQRTAALQAMLAKNAHVALALVVHKMAGPIFWPGDAHRGSPLKLVSTLTGASRLSDCASNYAQSPAGIEMEQLGDMWGDRLPGGDGQASILAWFVKQDDATLLDLLAFCAAGALDAMHGRERHSYGEADALADALNLDMADWWSATGEKYLASVSKAQLFQAVTQACGGADAAPLPTMNKADAVAYAQSKLEGTRWLPAPLQRKTMAA